MSAQPAATQVLYPLDQTYKKEKSNLGFRLVGLVALLYLFLVGVKSLEGAISLMGSGISEGLFSLASNPFLGLMIGTLATALIQSSSATTSIVVGLVSAGTLTVPGAIPIIMGANIGTSVTNSIVSLGYLKESKSFKNAFAAATVHTCLTCCVSCCFCRWNCLRAFCKKQPPTLPL